MSSINADLCCLWRQTALRSCQKEKKSLIGQSISNILAEAVVSIRKREMLPGPFALPGAPKERPYCDGLSRVDREIV
jgi:hypothetical protein